MLGYLIGLALLGLVAGALARLVVPGRDPMGIGATILLGIVGSFIGGLIGRAIGDEQVGIILAVIGSVIALLVWRQVQRKRV